MIRISTIFLALFTLSVSAKSAKRSPAQVKGPALDVQIQFGEKHTDFGVEAKGDAYEIHIANSDGQYKKKSLRKADFETIVTAFDSLPNPAELPQSCYRSYMVVTRASAGKLISKRSCIGVGGHNAEEFAKFSNLLLLPF